jgi:diguanylate cyclase (GGDEF)-like protein
MTEGLEAIPQAARGALAMLAQARTRVGRSWRARAGDRLSDAVELARLVAFERSIIAHSPFATLVTDAEGTITSVNDAAARMLCYERAALVGRVTPLVLLEPSQLVARAAALSVTRNERVDPGFGVLRAMAECGPAGKPEWELVRGDGTRLHAALAVSALTTGAGAFAGLLLIAYDITDRKRAEAQVSHRADHDPLTGLPTRRLLADRLGAALARAEQAGADEAGGRVGVLMVDLDGFKRVNDVFGHTIGDALLCAVADRLRRAVRAEDTVARIGGDEFVVVLGDLTTVADAEGVARAIEHALDGPLLLGLEQSLARASVGICVYPDHGRTADELLQHADAAMYGAKREGRHGHRNFVADVTLGEAPRAA